MRKFSVAGVFPLRLWPLSVLLYLAVCACSSSLGSPQNVASFPGGSTEQLASAQDALRSLAAPAGVDLAAWRMLQAELIRVLDSRPAGVKSVSTPPVTGGSRAVLSLDMSAGGNGVLRWGLYLHGDCNQDGQVGVADLAPLGQRFGEVSPGGLGVPFPADSSGAVLDGSWDGSINLPDVAPIGQNWGCRTAGYRVYRSHNPADVPQVAADANGEGAEMVADIALSSAIAIAGQRKRFELALAEAATDWLYWVRPYDGADEGTPSNSVPPTGADNLAPIAVLGAEPSSGLAPLSVQLQGFSSGDLDGIIVKYEWDFDGVVGGENWADTGAQGWVEHVYDAPGDYLPLLRVTDNAGGQATDTVLVKVRVPHPPVAALSVTPDSGPVVLYVVFDAGGSTDQDGPIAKYEWDWQSDGTYDYDSGTTPTADFYCYSPGTITATVRVTDIDGLTSTAQASVDVTAGATWHTITAVEAKASIEIGGDHLSQPTLTEVNGCPAIFYTLYVYDAAENVNIFEEVWYIRASDSAGYEWDDPVYVAKSTEIDPYWVITGIYPFAVTGAAGVLFSTGYNNGMGGFSGHCYAVTSYNVNGTSWRPRTLAFDFGLSLQSPILQYGEWLGLLQYSNAGGKIKTGFYSSNDPAGADWSIPYVPSSILLNMPSLGVIDGSPALVFSREVGAVNTELDFTRALNPEGLAWPETPTVIASSFSGIGDAELVVADGHPLVFYFDLDLDQLYCVRPLDPSCTAWSEPELLLSKVQAEVFDNSGYYDWTNLSLSAISHNGKPVVFYKDNSGRSMALPANNSAGTSWSFPFEVPMQDALPGSIRSVCGNLSFVFNISSEEGSDYVTQIRFCSLF